MAYLADDTPNRKFAINQKPQDTLDEKVGKFCFNEWIISFVAVFTSFQIFNTKIIKAAMICRK